MATIDFSKNEIEKKSYEECIQDDFNELTTHILESSQKISDKSGESKVAEKYSTDLLRTVSDFKEEVMSSETLYKPLSSDHESTYINIIKLLRKYLENLNTAVEDYDDEISRENEMTQFSRLFYELDYLPYDNQNFIDVVNALRVGILSKLDPYSLQEIVCLKTAINDLMQNLNMTDKKYFEILDKLEQNNFNITGPLSEISHAELTYKE